MQIQVSRSSVSQIVSIENYKNFYAKVEKMMFIEIIVQFFVEAILIDIIGGTISRINNLVLKLIGIETKSVKEIKLDKLKRRYEYKTVQFIKRY